MIEVSQFIHQQLNKLYICGSYTENELKQPIDTQVIK